MSRYLTIDVEGLESFNDKCNQLAKQDGIPNSPVHIIPYIDNSFDNAFLKSLKDRYVQQWLLPDSPGPESNVSTEEL